MLKILLLANVFSSLLTPTILIDQNISEKLNIKSDDYNNQNLYSDLIDIRNALPGGDLGKFNSKELAREKLDSLIEQTGYDVIVRDDLIDVFILEGNETSGYTGISIYTYRTEGIDISSKLPGAYLGVFKTKELARERMDSIIATTTFVVNVDDKQNNKFIISGVISAGYTGTSEYTYDIDPKFINIKDKLPGAYLGYFINKQDAINAMEKLIIRSGYKVFIEDNEDLVFKISGDETAGYTGTSIYTYDLY